MIIRALSIVFVAALYTGCANDCGDGYRNPDEQCECRKPKPGLLLRIAEHAGQALNQTDFVGDSLKDIEAALAAHANPVLVLTGNGKRTRETLESNVVTFQDLADYADFKITM